MRISWLHPDVAELVRAVLQQGLASWAEAFTDDDAVRIGAPPAGIAAPSWPRIAEHVARGERVRELVSQAGWAAAQARFGASPHAVERAQLVALRSAAAPASASEEAEIAEVLGVLGCAIDEQLAYGHFLSRLVELGAAHQPDVAVAAFERFVLAARAVPAVDQSWPERLRLAEDGLGSLYVRVGRADDAEALFAGRFASEVNDATVAITAARAFLEHGDVGRAVSWLERGAGRAKVAGRAALADTLAAKARSLRSRLS